VRFRHVFYTLPAAVVLLGACSGPPSGSGFPDLRSSSAITTAHASSPVSVALRHQQLADPVSVAIPSLNIAAPTQHLELDAFKALNLAPLDQTPSKTGWYEVSPSAPVVVMGHVDYRGNAVFGTLHTIKTGSTVVLTRSDGMRQTYVVYLLEQIKKKAFPTRAVYGPTAQLELRLVTCDGVFSRSERSYIDSFIAYARLQP